MVEAFRVTGPSYYLINMASRMPRGISSPVKRQPTGPSNLPNAVWRPQGDTGVPARLPAGRPTMEPVRAARITLGDDQFPASADRSGRLPHFGANAVEKLRHARGRLIGEQVVEYSHYFERSESRTDRRRTDRRRPNTPRSAPIAGV